MIQKDKYEKLFLKKKYLISNKLANRDLWVSILAWRNKISIKKAETCLIRFEYVTQKKDKNHTFFHTQAYIKRISFLQILLSLS